HTRSDRDWSSDVCSSDLSGLANIYNGLPGTTTASEFNQLSPIGEGTPSSLVGMPNGSFTFNGAIGLVPDPEALVPCPGTTTAGEIGRASCRERVPDRESA